MNELNNSYFEALKTLRPEMEEYNKQLVLKFERYLQDPSLKSLNDIVKLRESRISASAANAYGYVNYLHIITDLAMEELQRGYAPVTEGTGTYKEAIDKYHKIIFMKRRCEFVEDEEVVAKAREYILKQNVSPITMSYIIDNEYGARSEDIKSDWDKVLSENRDDKAKDRV